MKPILPLLTAAALFSPILVAQDQNETIRVEIKTPSPLWDLEIKQVYRASDHLIVIAQASQSEKGLMGAAVMGKASASIDLLDPQLVKLPRKIYVIQEWNYSEGYTSIFKEQIPGIIQGATLLYDQDASTTKKVSDKPKAEDLIGLSPEDAKALCDKHDIKSRIVSVDGKPRPATMDYRPDRFNFHVENGKIVKVSKG